MKARRISAVLCSGDLGQSQTFYEQVVGLTLSADTIPNHLLFECGDGTTLLVYGRPAPNKADHTQVRFGPTTSSTMFGNWRAAALCLRTTTSPRSGPSVTLPQRLASASRPGSGPGRKHARTLPTRVAAADRQPAWREDRGVHERPLARGFTPWRRRRADLFGVIRLRYRT